MSNQNSMNVMKPFQIGNVHIDPPLILAPMAGVTHSPLRQLVASLGAPGLFFSEMLSASKIPHDCQNNSVWLARTERERPMAYQIFTSSAEEAATAVGLLVQKTHCEIVDLNLACPAPNIAGKRKAGGHLLSDLQKIEKILKAIHSQLDRPLTAKIRLGKKPDLIFLKDFAALLEGCGVAAVTLHPRLTTEKLKRRARWEYIGHLKTMVAIPVIGNGDVQNKEDCIKMFRQTGCDGVMIGRAAIQKPWIFSTILYDKEEALQTETLKKIYFDALQRIIDYFPKDRAKGRIKEFTWYFSQNFKFGHGFAARFQSLASLADCLDYAARHFPVEPA